MTTSRVGSWRVVLILFDGTTTTAARWLPKREAVRLARELGFASIDRRTRTITVKQSNMVTTG